MTRNAKMCRPHGEVDCDYCADQRMMREEMEIAEAEQNAWRRSQAAHHPANDSLDVPSKQEA